MLKQSVFWMLVALGALSLPPARAEALTALWVDPIIFKINLDPQFEYQNGALTLKEYVANAIGPNHVRILWSGSLGAQPQRFVLETTESQAALKDADGHTLWVEQYAVPSLTLDFSQAGQAKLTDEAGQTLWAGPWDGKRTPRSGSQGRAECNGFALVCQKGEAARLEDQHGQLLWTGPTIKGDGLYIIDYGKRSALAWHAIPFPVNEKIAYDIADVPENVTVEDKDHAALGSQTVPTIQITKRYSQGYYAAHPIVSQITPTVMPLPPAPGAYTVTFQDQNGARVQSQALEIDSVNKTAIAGGHVIETAHFHVVTRNAAGQITEDNTSSTSSELPAAAGEK